MKKQIFIPIFIVGLFSMITVASNAYAYQGDYTKKGPNYTAERHTIMQTAFGTNNYEMWKTEMQKTNSGKRVLSIINKDNFSKFAEANKLGLAGKTIEAQKIRTELGLGIGSGKGMGCKNR